MKSLKSLQSAMFGIDPSAVATALVALGISSDGGAVADDATAQLRSFFRALRTVKGRAALAELVKAAERESAGGVKLSHDSGRFNPWLQDGSGWRNIGISPWTSHAIRVKE